MFANSLGELFVGREYAFDAANPGAQPGGLFHVMLPSLATVDRQLPESADGFVRETIVPLTLESAINGRRIVSFDLGDVQASLGPTDQLLVYLIDPADPSGTVLDRGTTGTSLLSITRDNAEVRTGLVRFDGRRATIDATSISGEGERAFLVFQLLGSGQADANVTIGGIANEFEEEETPATAIDLPNFPVLPSQAEVVLAEFMPADGYEVLLRNARHQTNTGSYEVELRVRNMSAMTPRNILVGLTGLPAGVEVLDAIVFGEDGTPYVSVLPGIPAGGLAPGVLSEPIRVRINNPENRRFAINPAVLVGGPNRAPVLEPVGELSVMPGGYLDVAALASDPDGDTLSFQVVSDGGLPSGRLSSTGSFVFTPSPEEIGSYDFTLVVSDGAATATQNVRVNVVPDPDMRSRISGTVLDVDGTPLVGVPITMGDGDDEVEVLTNAQGEFLLVLPDGFFATYDTVRVEAQQLSIPGVVYPFVAEKMPLVLGFSPYEGYNNVIGRPIYLPKIDVASGSLVDPTQTTEVANESLGAAVSVAAGTLEGQDGQPFEGVLSISGVPTQLTPAALPMGMVPDIVVTIQPAEMVFTRPAPLTLPNLSGFAPDTMMNLWSINPLTGQFDDVGDGRVSTDGSVIDTISGGVRNSSWHFFIPPEPTVTMPDDDKANEHRQCTSCGEQAPVNSMVELHGGYLNEAHTLLGYQSQGIERSLTLRYDTFRADPRPIVHFGFDNVRPQSDDLIVANLRVERGAFSQELAGLDGNPLGIDAQLHVWTLPVDGGTVKAALQTDLRSQPTGTYQYTVMTGLLRDSLRDDGSRQLTGSMSNVQGSFVVVNEIDSAFGSGWSIAGLQRIIRNPDGSVLLVDGDGSQLRFEDAGDGVYTSPSGDFSTLTVDGSGLFVRTFKNGTVATFDTGDRLVRVEDRNGNATRHIYNAQGLIERIIDPVNLETAFVYGANGKVSTITDPAGRVTTLAYNARGDLASITDPDGSSRTFSYDASHRMIGEIDKRGFAESVRYDFAGRVQEAIRKDGTVALVRPAQVVGLSPARLTTDLDNAPAALVRDDAQAVFVDPNGNTTIRELDRRGQLVSGVDQAGPLSQRERDETTNLVTMNRDPRGFLSAFAYDALGNMTGSTDPIGSATYEYDPTFSRVTRMIDELGRETLYEIDSDSGDMLSMTHPDGTTMVFTYNAAGQMLTSIDELGTLTRYQYNPVGRMIRITEAEGTPVEAITTMTYDSAGNVATRTDANGNTTSYAYDALDRLLSVTDALGNVWTYEYDQAGNAIRTTDARGNVTANEFDELGRVTRSIAADGGVMAYTYDQAGNLASTTDAVGQVTTYAYDARNRLDTSTDARGGVTEYRYDRADNLVRVTDPIGNVTRFFYDSRNRLVSEVQDGVGEAEEVVVDLTQWRELAHAGGNPTRWEVTGDDSDVVRTLDNLEVPGFFISNESIIDAQVAITGGVFGGDNDFIGFVFGMTTTIADVPDSYYLLHWKGGQQGSGEEGVKLLKVTNAGEVSSGSMYNQLYDGEDSANVEVLFENIGAETGWDNNVSYVFELVYRSSGTFDIIIRAEEDGELIQRINFTDTSPLTGDQFGFFSISQASTEYSVGFNRSPGKSYLYDQADNLVATFDRNGRRIDYLYDQRDRVVAEQWLPEPGTTSDIYEILYTYDNASNLLTATDPASSLAMTYDDRYRVASVDTSGTVGVPPVTLEYTYDAVGNRLTMRERIDGPVGAITTYEHDALNRTTGITQRSGSAAIAVTGKHVDIVYNELGQITGLDRHSNAAGTALLTTSAFMYDTVNRVTSIEHTLADATVAERFAYTYDLASRITSIADGVETIDYQYDATNQLTGTVYSDAGRTSEAYDYDLNGNRLSSHRSATYITDVHNRLVEDDTHTYEYDLEGNLILRTSKADASTRTFEWDHRNRLTRVTDANSGGQPQQVAEYAYDTADRRILKTVTPFAGGAAGTSTSTGFVYDAEDIVLRFEDADGPDGSAAPALSQRVLHGPGIDMPLLVEIVGQGLTLSLLTDHLGTIHAEAATDGTIARRTYDAYGAVTATQGTMRTDYAFTGRELDGETGLMYYRARYYDVEVGRFVGQDPLSFLAGDANLFRYVLGSPTLFIDPYGRCPDSNPYVDGAKGAAIGAGSSLANDGAVRDWYAREVAKLDPTDSAGRTQLKMEARARSSEFGRRFAEHVRPSSAEASRVGGTASRSNPGVNRGASVLGGVGRASVATAAGVSAYRIYAADSDARPRIIAQESGSWTGALAFGAAGAKGGAAVGAFFTPLGALIGAGIGGLVGSIAGGIFGAEAGDSIYSSITGPYDGAGCGCP